ncbi:nucleotidyl transferase AbiEii/AbiGii toxin family protein [Patescibacteria group bacterium]|nr:nucleotidyl transferase AbiEii/AbiGii toxin family protein [Patescibacteria group bacterium]
MFKTGDKGFMDASYRQIKWHLKMLPRQTKEALDFLSKESWLKDSGWYLAGGTALALQAGHRKSYDLDFFSQTKEFDNEELLANFSNNKNWLVSVNKKNTIYGELLKAQVSFIAYPFFVPKQNFLQYGNISVLDKIDISVMKITAISQRGRKRDFFDLYFCAQNIEPLEKIIKRLKVQYPSVAHNYHHILKALVYFEDAESDPEPEINFKAGWQTVKDFFNKEVPATGKKLAHWN